MISFSKSIFIVFVFSFLSLFSIPKDIIIANSGGANSTYFSLANGVVLSDPISKWDIAFMVGTDASIRINDAANHQLWLVPIKNAFDFGNALDTNAMLSWQEMHNSDTLWTMGAFNNNKNGFANQGDFGWGMYNPNDHSIVGSKIFVLKINASTYKQVLIESLTAVGFKIKYANIDGTNPKSMTINLANYAGKNFVGLSMIDDKIYDKEPLSKDWDLVGTKFTGLTPDGQGNLLWYSLFGFFSNTRPVMQQGQPTKTFAGVKVAQVDNADLTVTTLPKLSDYNSNINEIGSDWKQYNNGYTFPKRVYFAQRFDSLNVPSGLIYKFSFKNYSNFSTTFSQDNVLASVSEDDNSNISNATVYPNEISKGENLNLVITSRVSNLATDINIYNIVGNLVATRKINLNADFSHILLNDLNLISGLYFVQIGDYKFKTPIKFIIK